MPDRIASCVLLDNCRPRFDLNYDYGPNYESHRAKPPIRQGFLAIGEEMYQTRQERVPKDRRGHSDRFLHYGIHRILRQTHPHPDQQHHCRLMIPDIDYEVIRCFLNYSQPFSI
ncbi:Hypothetical protein NTJ_12463 [Nesidiocoris tenuis]|uniref:Uncharacterized protein n=1 Tax=Nesidiocoris tenuis TaxID=355587 RepID=A0ABN7B8W3_9HEMI|nr:Hypothetical protein NTJ_12463 [Nesidiocoris tenuis]